MTKIFELITLTDVFYCALASLAITGIIRLIVRVFGRASGFGLYNISQLNRIIENFYLLFPVEDILFKGETFRRGMIVRVTTIAPKIIEGLLIGLNSENELCVLTRTSVSTNMLDNILDITVLENKE